MRQRKILLVVALAGCTPQSTTPGGSAQIGEYLGVFGGRGAGGTFSITHIGSSGSLDSATVGVKLVTGTTLTLQGKSAAGANTFTDGNGNSCTAASTARGISDSVITGTCTFPSLGGVTAFAGLRASAHSDTLAFYCGTESGSGLAVPPAALLIGIMGTRAVIARADPTDLALNTAGAGTVANGSISMSPPLNGGATVSYTGTISGGTASGSIASSGASSGVGTTWTAAAPCTPPTLAVHPDTIQISALTVGPTPAPQGVIVETTTGAPWVETIDSTPTYVSSGQSWLAPSISGSSIAFAISGSPSALGAGTYTATTRAWSPLAVNSPLPITVVYNIQVPTSSAIVLSSAVVGFTANAGGGAAIVEPVSVTSSDSSSLSGVTATTAYKTGPAGWLTASLDASTIPDFTASGDRTTILSLQSNATSLPAGMDTAVVTIASTTPGAAPATLIVQIAVSTYSGLWSALAQSGGSQDFLCGLNLTGLAYCWDEVPLTQTGTYSVAAEFPVPVLGASNIAFASVVAGADFACGLTASGSAYCWGSNKWGQLGNGTRLDSGTPTLVGGGSWRQLAAAQNGEQTCGLSTTGAAYCWGINDEQYAADAVRQEGDSVPAPVRGGLTFTSIAAADGAACAIDEAKAAWCWGHNVGTTQAANGPATPLAVAGGLQWQSLSMSALAVCGVTTSQDAYCWGYNYDNNLATGDGNQTDTVPHLVQGGFKYTSVVTIGTATCGITTSAALYCWGYALGEQPGRNGVTLPLPTFSGLSWESVTVSYDGPVICGIIMSGAAYCNGQPIPSATGSGSRVKAPPRRTQTILQTRAPSLRSH